MLLYLSVGKIQGAVGNSWGILIAILCHKYHQNHSDRVILSETQNLQLKVSFYHVCVFHCF